MLGTGHYSVPSGNRLPRAAREVGLPFAHGSRAGGPYAAAPSGSPDVHRRFLPAPGGRELAHAHRRRTDLRGPAPAFDDFLDHIRGRLHLVPRYRQRLATPPLETGRPLWVDDPNFNLEYHVRHTALPEPGTERPAVPAGRADRLAAARPLEAAVGELAGRGPRGRPLRADLQDAPRARRRRLRRGPGDGPVRSRANPAKPRRGARAVAPQPEPSQRTVGRRRRARDGQPNRVAGERAPCPRRHAPPPRST